MPKTKTPELDPLSVRLPRELGAQLRAEAVARETSVNEVITQALLDAQTFYDLPHTARQRLEADAATTGLSRREYIRNLLNARSEQLLLESRPGRPVSEKKPRS